MPAPSITITLDYLSIVLLVSSFLYGFCLLLACKKLSYLDRISPIRRGDVYASSSPSSSEDGEGGLGPKRLLVWSVMLVCAIRIMTFIGVAAMDISNVRAHYSLRPVDWRDKSHHRDDRPPGPIDKNQAFYDAAMTVLFDLPNCVIVSLFVLLSLVQTECFLMSRFHNQSTYQWKKRSLMFFTGFNSVLYSTQFILYSLVIAGTASGVVRTVLYAATPTLNFLAVLLVLAVYLYANVNFAGYPFRSSLSRERLRKISNVLLLWSATRVLWGLGMLYVFLANVELLQDSQTPFRSATALFLLLLTCEIIPVLVLLDYSYMSIAGFESGATRDMSALASGQRALGDDGSMNDDVNGSIFDTWKEQHGELFGEFAPVETEEPLLGPEG